MRDARRAELTYSMLGTPRHICAFFNDGDEAFRALIPFITEGLECGQKAVHIVRSDGEEAHRHQLREAGIDVAACEASGQLEIRRNTDAYLVDGEFNPDRMLGAFEDLASGKANGPFPLSRIICDMCWASSEAVDQHVLIEFEARANELWSRHEDAVICVYNLKNLSGEMVVDIMRTHPIVLIGNLLQENPFFTPPAEFLRDQLASRGSSAIS